MKRTQIYEIMNAVADEVLGVTGIVMEDLSNIVDVGNQMFNAMETDAYVKKLVDKVGKVVFVNKPYKGTAPSVLMDAWEYGSVKQKITVASLPDVVANSSWALTNGQSYDPNVFNSPDVSSKFYDTMVTFEIDMSFTERQLKSAFNSVDELNGFLSMIETAIQDSFTIRMNALIMETINNMSASILSATFGYNYTSPTTVKMENAGIMTTNTAVNLLKMYNDSQDPTPLLTKEKCIYDKDFLRFASYTISLWSDYLRDITVNYNAGHLPRFTTPEDLHIVMLSQFARGVETYMLSDVYHNELIKLPNGYETVQKWQGAGSDHGFANVSKINVTPKNYDGSHAAFEMDGILAVMFDREALGVTNQNKRVTTAYNAKAEFYNNFYKYDASYFNDFNENFVVFYVADAPAG